LGVFYHKLFIIKKSKMKSKSMFTAFTLKALIVITVFTIGFAAFTKCEAQSPAGKWNKVSGKQYFTPEAAKTLGKAFVEVPMASAGSSVIEFKADHTYIKTLSGKYHPTPVILTGTWSASGSQFEMKINTHQADPKTNPIGNAAATTTTVSVSGNTLTVSVPVSGDNPMMSKINRVEEIYEKM
jgi:hypothetical protein